MLENKLGDLFQQLGRLWHIFKPDLDRGTWRPPKFFHFGVGRQLYLLVYTVKAKLFRDFVRSPIVVKLQHRA